MDLTHTQYPIFFANVFLCDTIPESKKRDFPQCFKHSQKKLTSSLPSARSNAVSSSMFRSIVSAPDWQRRLAMVVSCLPTARCRGVQPLNMAASTLAPLLRRNFTDVMSWSSTARWRAVFPLVPSCEGASEKKMVIKFRS